MSWFPVTPYQNTTHRVLEIVGACFTAVEAGSLRAVSTRLAASESLGMSPVAAPLLEFTESPQASAFPGPYKPLSVLYLHFHTMFFLGLPSSRGGLPSRTPFFFFS